MKEKNKVKSIEAPPFSGASWVFSYAEERVNCYAEITETFEFSGGSAKIRICSGRDYALYLNGVFVDCGQYEAYPGNAYYDETEIGRYLRAGLNRIAVLGYLKERTPLVKGVIYEIESEGKILLRSGANTRARVARTYRSGETEGIGNGRYYAAYCAPSDGWTKGEDEEGFAAAATFAADETFLPRPVKKCEILPCEGAKIVAQGLFDLREEGASLSKTLSVGYLSARRPAYFSEEEFYPTLPCEGISFRHAGKEGIYLVVDMGEETTGYLTLDVETEAPAVVRYAFGEHLTDLRVRGDARNYAGEISLPAGRTDFTDYIQRLGLRYLMLFFSADRFRLYRAGVRPSFYPLKEIPYRASDALAQKIYDVSLHTLRCCMHEHYEDCPHREQYQYAMDSRTQMLCGYYAFGEYEFARAALLQMGEALSADGNIFLVTPQRTGPEIPVFTLVYVSAVQEYTEHSGDRSVFDARRETLDRICDGFLSRIDRTGLIPEFEDDWNFYGWREGLINKWGDNPQPEGSVVYSAPLNCHLIVALERLAALYDGADGGRAKSLRAAAAALRRRVDDAFFDENMRGYATYLREGTLFHECDLTQVLALYADVPTGERKEALYDRAARERDDLALNDLIFKYDVLLRREEYRDCVRRDILSRWGRMLFDGATTFWETEGGGDDFHYAGSLCHGWSAVPAYVFAKYKLFS